MKKIKNKKGFTLIELLAVIVVLAIIMLIASQNVGGMITKARQNTLKIAGESAVDATKTAYQMQVLEGEITTGDACFSLAWLYKNNYYEKGRPASNGREGDGYSGSVLVKEENGAYIYKFWISNGGYAFENVTYGENEKVITTSNPASSTCGGANVGNQAFIDA